jgi:cbb3-type cytochrome oxidase maturation protein
LARRYRHGQQFTAGGGQRSSALALAADQQGDLMDIMYLLVPLSVVLVFFIIGGVWWAIYRGQFEDVDKEGERILKD